MFKYHYAKTNGGASQLLNTKSQQIQQMNQEISAKAEMGKKNKNKDLKLRSIYEISADCHRITIMINLYTPDFFSTDFRQDSQTETKSASK